MSCKIISLLVNTDHVSVHQELFVQESHENFSIVHWLQLLKMDADFFDEILIFV